MILESRILPYTTLSSEMVEELFGTPWIEIETPASRAKFSAPQFVLHVLRIRYSSSYGYAHRFESKLTS
jgi:hypothetical protein